MLNSELAVAATVGDHDGFAPLFHGCEGDAARAAGGVDAPGEVALAVPLKFAGASKSHAIGCVWRDSIANGDRTGCRIGGYWCGRHRSFHGCWRLIGGATGYWFAVHGAGGIAAGRCRADLGDGTTVEVGIGVVLGTGRVGRENVAAP